MSDWTDDDRARFDEAARIIQSGDEAAMVEFLSGCTPEKLDELGGYSPEQRDDMKPPRPGLAPKTDEEFSERIDEQLDTHTADYELLVGDDITPTPEWLDGYKAGLEEAEAVPRDKDCVTHHYCDCTGDRIKRLHATLDNHERLIDRIRDERDKLRLSVAMANADYDEVLDRANQYRCALERIASTNRDPRPDGTYNISREALIQIASRSLDDVNNLYHSAAKVKDKSHE